MEWDFGIYFNAKAKKKYTTHNTPKKKSSEKAPQILKAWKLLKELGGIKPRPLRQEDLKAFARTEQAPMPPAPAALEHPPEMLNLWCAQWGAPPDPTGSPGRLPDQSALLKSTSTCKQPQQGHRGSCYPSHQLFTQSAQHKHSALHRGDTNLAAVLVTTWKRRKRTNNIKTNQTGKVNSF